MSERPRDDIVDFHLAAFNTEVAIAYGYDTKSTPRTPVARFYTEHRAYGSFREVVERRIPWGDERLAELGLTEVGPILGGEEPVRFYLRGLVRVMRDRVDV
jgi:hypothetical protein